MDCKQTIDITIVYIVNNIQTLYEPLKQVITSQHNSKLTSKHKLNSNVQNRHVLTRTLKENEQLVPFKDIPQYSLIYKTLPKQAHKIAMAIHVRAQEWLTLMSKLSRKHPQPAPRITK